jgi:hypothetical protein
LIEVVAIDVDEVPFLQWLEFLRRISGEIAHDAHDEWNVLLHRRIAHLHIICNVNAGLPNPIECVLS